MNYPTEYKYTKDHEWAFLNNGIVTVGITHHAQDALGDIVFCELPKIGRQLKFHETFGVVESIKAVSDLYSPLSGEVIEVNKALETEPSLLNSEPHSNAWLMKLKATDLNSLNELMSASEYTQFVQSLK